eukprot:NODE_591_length_6340_cov_0.231533.p4 type:complete len:156 gc:universal NODE_591_length_6340_cov_0.231533:3892-3425(-)
MSLRENISLIFYNWSVLQYTSNQIDKTKLIWFVDTITEHLQTYYYAKKAFIDEVEDILMDVLEAEFHIYLEDGCPEIAHMMVMAKNKTLNQNLLKQQSESKPCHTLQYLLTNDVEHDITCDVSSCNDCDSSFEHVEHQFKQLDIDDDGWTIVKHK